MDSILVRDKVSASSSPEAAPAKNIGLRPMQRADLPEIERMFFNIFRGGKPTSHPQFIDYFHRLFFTGPAGGQGVGW